MDSQHVQRWQAEQLLESLRPALQYLHRLKGRMEKVGFVPGDPLYDRVVKAHQEMQALFTEVHYLTCEHGVD